MPAKAFVGDRKVLLVSAFIAPLVAADEQNGRPVGIEREKDSPRIATELNPQFLHVGERGPLQRIDIGPSELRPMLPQQVGMRDDFVSQVGLQASEPSLEIVIELDIPFHWAPPLLGRNIFRLRYSIKAGMIAAHPRLH